MTQVTLQGGPLDGQTLDVDNPRGPLLITGDPVPEGQVARYRPTREKGVMRFREYDTIVGKLPRPGVGS